MKPTTRKKLSVLQLAHLIYWLSLNVWTRLPATMKAVGYWASSAKYGVGMWALVLDDEKRRLTTPQSYNEPIVLSLPGSCVQSNERLNLALRCDIHEEAGLSVNIGDIIFIGELWPRRLDVFFVCQPAHGVFNQNPETDNIIFVPFPFDSLSPLFNPVDLLQCDHYALRLEREVNA
jgi:hypothetical protein